MFSLNLTRLKNVINFTKLGNYAHSDLRFHKPTHLDVSKRSVNTKDKSIMTRTMEYGYIIRTL